MAERMSEGKTRLRAAGVVRALACALCLWMAVATAYAQEVQPYSNARYGYSIDVPTFLQPQGESDNGDGQVFLASDGGRLTVFAGYELEPRTLEQMAHSWSKDRQVTYRRIKDNWFALSGFEGSKVFYQKTFLVDETAYTFILQYAAAQRQRYDPLAAALAKSFTVPNSGQ